jgi:hypothetical protein
MNKEQIIGKEFTLDLGSTPVQVVIKNITKDKVIVEYLNSTYGRIEEFSISDFEYFAMIKIDNNKNLIDEAYVNYGQKIISEDLWMLVAIGWPSTQDEFINKIKTDNEFAKKWGLKIEERELSLEERISLFSKNVNGKHLMKYADSDGLDMWNKILNSNNIPTKLITITYNGEKIESYE